MEHNITCLSCMNYVQQNWDGIAYYLVETNDFYLHKMYVSFYLKMGGGKEEYHKEKENQQNR